jgi:hypothetical protein
MRLCAEVFDRRLTFTSKVVVEIARQPKERVAHRRLRQVHALGGAAHGAQMLEMRSSPLQERDQA